MGTSGNLAYFNIGFRAENSVIALNEFKKGNYKNHSIRDALKLITPFEEIFVKQNILIV